MLALAVELPKGMTIGRWTVVRESYRKDTTNGDVVFYKLRCQCGQETIKSTSYLQKFIQQKTGGCRRQSCANAKSA